MIQISGKKVFISLISVKTEKSTKPTINWEGRIEYMFTYHKVYKFIFGIRMNYKLVIVLL